MFFAHGGAGGLAVEVAFVVATLVILGLLAWGVWRASRAGPEEDPSGRDPESAGPTP